MRMGQFSHGSIKRHEMQTFPQWALLYKKNLTLRHMRGSGTFLSHSKQKRNSSEKPSWEVENRQISLPLFMVHSH